MTVLFLCVCGQMVVCVKLQYVIHISACHRLVKAQLNANLGVSEKFWNIVSL